MMEIKDLKFERTKTLDQYNDQVKDGELVPEWVARTPEGRAVAYGDTKEKCIDEARLYLAFRTYQTDDGKAIPVLINRIRPEAEEEFALEEEELDESIAKVRKWDRVWKVLNVVSSVFLMVFLLMPLIFHNRMSSAFPFAVQLAWFLLGVVGLSLLIVKLVRRIIGHTEPALQRVYDRFEWRRETYRANCEFYLILSSHRITAFTYGDGAFSFSYEIPGKDGEQPEIVEERLSYEPESGPEDLLIFYEDCIVGVESTRTT